MPTEGVGPVVTAQRPRTRGYDPTWRVFDGGTDFALHPGALAAGPDMVWRPPYLTGRTDPAGLAGRLHPAILGIAADPFLPGRQPAAPLLPFLDPAAFWEPPATPLRSPPIRRQAHRGISRRVMAGAGVAALVAASVAAFLPLAIHANPRPVLAPLPAPVLVAIAAVPRARGPTAVRITLAPPPAAPPPDVAPDPTPVPPPRFEKPARRHRSEDRRAPFSPQLRFVVDLPRGIAPR